MGPAKPFTPVRFRSAPWLLEPKQVRCSRTIDGEYLGRVAWHSRLPKENAPLQGGRFSFLVFASLGGDVRGEFPLELRPPGRLVGRLGTRRRASGSAFASRVVVGAVIALRQEPGTQRRVGQKAPDHNHRGPDGWAPCRGTVHPQGWAPCLPGVHHVCAEDQLLNLPFGCSTHHSQQPSASR